MNAVQNLHQVSVLDAGSSVFMRRLGVFSVIWIIVTSGGVYFNSQGVVQFSLVFNVLLILFQQFYAWRVLVSVHKEEVLIFLLILGLVILTILSNSDYSSLLSYARFLVVLALVLSTSVIVSSRQFAEIFVKTVIFLSAVSVLFFYSDFLIENAGIFPAIYFYENIYINAFVYIMLVGLENRNLGIFIEPGLFQIYINFAIFLVINSSQRINYKFPVLVILFAALFSTNSTTGFIVGLIVVGGYIFSSANSKSDVLLLVVKIGAIVALMVGVIFSEFFYENIEEKFQGSQQLSYMTRQNSTLIDFLVFLDNPVMGVGFGGYDQAAYIYRSGGLVVDAATNTFTQLAAIFGFPLLALIAWRAYSYSRALLLGRVANLVIFVVYVVVFFTQPFVMYPLFYLPLFFLPGAVRTYRGIFLR